MEWLKRLWAGNPARVVGYTLALLTAVVDLLVAFGVVVPEEARLGMTTFLTTLIALISGGTEVIRSQVFAPSTVRNHLGYIPNAYPTDLDDSHSPD